MPVYERLCEVDNLSKQKQQAVLLLDGLERIVSGGLFMAAENNNISVVQKFSLLSQLTQEAKEAFNKSANAKLVLTRLFLAM